MLTHDIKTVSASEHHQMWHDSPINFARHVIFLIFSLQGMYRTNKLLIITGIICEANSLPKVRKILIYRLNCGFFLLVYYCLAKGLQWGHKREEG